MPMGKIFLVGAGPGDPGLLTVRGAELIASADVILYDGLANASLLQLAAPKCQLICVGKHGHGGMWTQREIDDNTVRLAKEGKRVVRLKGGDTSVFARTSEEIERYRAEGLAFEIVPGITAALAVAAYTGIPITHRDWSSAVALVTGQLQPTEFSSEPDDPMDWKGLAQFPGTLVMYMGVTTASHWSTKLIEAGKSPKTPVAMIRRCSWPDQEIIEAELGTIEAAVTARGGLRPPVVTVIGDVVRFAKDYDWFSSRPLFGLRLIVASPIASARQIVKLMHEQGADAIAQPAIEIVPLADSLLLDDAIRTVGEMDWVVFSSVHGVEAFWNRIHEFSLDARHLKLCKVASVGAGTAEALSRYHIQCDLQPAKTGGAAGLLEVLEPVCRGRSILLVRNPRGDTLLETRLRNSGARVSLVDAYSQKPIVNWPDTVLSNVEKGIIDAIVVTSRNVALRAIELLGHLAAHQRWLSLSPAITQLLNDHGCDKVITAEHTSFESLVEAAKQLRS